MKLYYLENELTEVQYKIIKSYSDRLGLTFNVFNVCSKPCWCCFTECEYDDVIIGEILANYGFKTLNIDAVLYDLDRLTNNYKLKEKQK